MFFMSNFAQNFPAMATPIKIERLDDPRIAVFSGLTERQLRNVKNPEEALFIVESPKVIAVALEAGYQAESFLCEQRHIAGDAAPLLARCPEAPVYTGSRELLSALTGYTLTRGVLCAMRRPSALSLEEVAGRPGRRRIAVVDSVVDSTNIGSIFRSAAALGIDGVVLTHTSCDPLNRRSVRVSMGSVFLVPWTWCESASDLKAMGYRTVALALTDRSVSIKDPVLNGEERLALILGTEGTGLEQSVIDSADYTARIPMHNGVDSLNVGVAAAIAFYQLVD